jgi:hypothetical protein
MGERKAQEKVGTGAGLPRKGPDFFPACLRPGLFSGGQA